uniref:OBP6 n=1 Tax=Holotrichia parallela TaxID=93412 RepID=A0A0G2YIT0_HOLPA|nr:OBP6 [Holotrichia parallela]
MNQIILFVSLAIFMTSNCLDVTEYAEECIEEFGLETSNLTGFDEKMRTGVGMTHSDKCLALCCITKVGIVKDGEVDEAVLLKYLGPGATVDLEKCRILSDDDSCEKYYKIFDCMNQQKVQKPSI